MLSEEYENKINIFDDMLGSKQTKVIDAFFTQGKHQNLDIYYLSDSWYQLRKNSIRNNSTRIVLIP